MTASLHKVSPASSAFAVPPLHASWPRSRHGRWSPLPRRAGRYDRNTKGLLSIACEKFGCPISLAQRQMTVELRVYRTTGMVLPMSRAGHGIEPESSTNRVFNENQIWSKYATAATSISILNRRERYRVTHSRAALPQASTAHILRTQHPTKQNASCRPQPT